MAIDFETFFKVVPSVIEAKFPVIIRGRHGIGKSEVVYQIAEQLKLDMVERRASQMTEGDLVGLPVIKGDTTSWNPPDWFKMACNAPVCLFLDEVDRAVVEVRQGIFELTDSRKLNGHKLHPGTVIFAAVNGGENGQHYQVGDMDPAELDRYTVFDVEPSIEDWLKYAEGKIDEIVWNFINQNRAHLEHRDDFEPNKVYPSRRSWFRFDKTLKNTKLLERPTPILTFLAQGFVGPEAALAFNDYVKNYERRVSVDDLLSGKVTKNAKKMKINEHNALIDELQKSGKLKVDLEKAQVQHMIEYFVRLPSEPAQVLLALISNDEESAMYNLTSITGGRSKDGTRIRDRMLELIAGKNVGGNKK
tara:strand:- start:4793 stop:5875 length:1083 start_codon:yes stop_codon:yes gene_type:complete